MDKPPDKVPTKSAAVEGSDEDVPTGDHPLEIAARREIGPLSPRGREVWHGDAIPCVTCGQLVLRDDDECESCGQDLRREMIERMRVHAGPWTVLEHVRPFPGVTLERIIRQIRRGLLTETSIVRGPSTDFQWRYAVETPGLSRFFGKCWQCQATVDPAVAQCPLCEAIVGFKPAHRPTGRPPTPERGAAFRSETERATPAHAAASKATPQPSNPERDRDAPPSPEAPRDAIVELDQTERPAAARPKSHTMRSVVDSAAEPAALHALSAAVGTAGLPDRRRIDEPSPRLGRLPVSWLVVLMVAIVILVLTGISQCRKENGGRPSTQTAPLKTDSP